MAMLKTGLGMLMAGLVVLRAAVLKVVVLNRTAGTYCVGGYKPPFLPQELNPNTNADTNTHIDIGVSQNLSEVRKEQIEVIVLIIGHSY